MKTNAVKAISKIAAIGSAALSMAACSGVKFADASASGDGIVKSAEVSLAPASLPPNVGVGAPVVSDPGADATPASDATGAQSQPPVTSQPIAQDATPAAPSTNTPEQISSAPGSASTPVTSLDPATSASSPSTSSSSTDAALPAMPDAPAPAPAASDANCGFGPELPATFAAQSADIQSADDVNVDARAIEHLFGVRGALHARGETLAEGAHDINGSALMFIGSIGGARDMHGDLCLAASRFTGDVHGIQGQVKLIGAANAVVPLSELSEVGGATLSNVQPNVVSSVHGDLIIENGGVISEIQHVNGRIRLVNTKVLYMHDNSGPLENVDSEVVLNMDAR